jgi:hypothetical protein
MKQDIHLMWIWSLKLYWTNPLAFLHNCRTVIDWTTAKHIMIYRYIIAPLASIVCCTWSLKGGGGWVCCCWKVLKTEDWLMLIYYNLYRFRLHIIKLKLISVYLSAFYRSRHRNLPSQGKTTVWCLPAKYPVTTQHRNLPSQGKTTVRGLPAKYPAQ